MPSETLYTLHSVRQQYGSRVVLNIPSLMIGKGEILAVVGPSGAGKSTLLHLLAFLETPAAGDVKLTLDNQPVSYPQITTEIRRRIAMVFQSPVMLKRSVRDNIAYGLRVRRQPNSQSRVTTVLKRLSLDHLADAPAHTLSGGEKQRIAVARTLVLHPHILLLDEATANLDPHNVALMERMICDQHEQDGNTIILVTHNIFQARRLATQVAFLLNGELVETASVAHFFTTPNDPRTKAFLSGDLVY